jgi:hypothetical protein
MIHMKTVCGKTMVYLETIISPLLNPLPKNYLLPLPFLLPIPLPNNLPLPLPLLNGREKATPANAYMGPDKKP